MCITNRPNTSPPPNACPLPATASAGNRAYSIASSTSYYAAYHPCTTTTTNPLHGLIQCLRQVKSTIKERGENFLRLDNQSNRHDETRRSPPSSRHASKLMHSDVEEAGLESMFARMEMTLVPNQADKNEMGREFGDGGMLLSRPTTTIPTDAGFADGSESNKRPLPYSDTPSLFYPERPEDYNHLGRLSDGSRTAPAELHEDFVAELPVEDAVHSLPTEEALVRDDGTADLQLQVRLQEMKTKSDYSQLPLAPFPDPDSNEFLRIRTTTFSIVPAAADGRAPYPVTPTIASPLPASVFATCGRPSLEPDSDREEVMLPMGMRKRKPLPNPMAKGKILRRKRALSIQERASSKRSLNRKVSLERPKVSRDAELHFDAAWLSQSNVSSVLVPPGSTVQLEGDVAIAIADAKKLKRRSRSLPEMYANYEAETMMVSATRSTLSGTPDVLKVGPLKASFPVGTRDKIGLPLSDEQSGRWKSPLPKNDDVYATYKPYVPMGMAWDDSEEVSAVTVKAEKLKNRIPSGVLPDQTPLMEVIQAATGKSLLLQTPGSPIGKLRNAETESPVSPLKGEELAWAFGTTAIAESELVNVESRPEPEPVVARIQTVRRVRASQVDMRSLARPIRPGEGPSTKNPSAGSFLDEPAPSNLPAIILPSKIAFASQQTNNDGDSSWVWGRFSDKEFKDPAVEHSQRFKDKKIWAKKNSGDLIEFEKGNNWKRRSALMAEEKRLSLMGMMRDKSIEELLNMFEGKD